MTTITTVGTVASEASNAYATLDDYQKWITMRGGDIAADAADDLVIVSMLEAASRHIDQETARIFYKSAADETRYYTPDDHGEVDVDELVSITTLYVDYTGLLSYSALTAADFTLYPRNASNVGFPYNRIVANTRITGAFFPNTRDAVKVVGPFGWPAVPSDIKVATMGIVQSLNGTRSGQTSQGKVTVTAAGIVIRPEDVPAFAQKIIDHYRNIT